MLVHSIHTAFDPFNYTSLPPIQRHASYNATLKKRLALVQTEKVYWSIILPQAVCRQPRTAVLSGKLGLSGEAIMPTMSKKLGNCFFSQEMLEQLLQNINERIKFVHTRNMFSQRVVKDKDTVLYIKQTK